jgi:hypothetical protein
MQLILATVLAVLARGSAGLPSVNRPPAPCRHDFCYLEAFNGPLRDYNHAAATLQAKRDCLSYLAVTVSPCPVYDLRSST